MAALVCWGGAVMALLAVGLLQGLIGAAYAALVGMGVRMVLALMAAFVWQFQGGSLAEAGAVYYLIAFYQVALLVETGWLVSRMSES